MSHYTHITTYERGKIEELSKLGLSTRQIAKRINRHHSSVARELNRLAEYKAETAQSDYAAKRLNSKPTGKYSESLSIII